MTESATRSTLCRRPFGDDPSAVLARARPHVDEMIGSAHHLLVVLDDQHRVADVTQVLERPDQAIVVALVEPDRRLVEDVQHAHELRADLRRKPQALGLPARKRRCGAVELEVPDADVVQERQALADLLQDPHRDLALPFAQRELLDELDRLAHRLLREVVDVESADGDSEYLRAQAGAAARGAGPG